MDEKPVVPQLLLERFAFRRWVEERELTDRDLHAIVREMLEDTAEETSGPHGRMLVLVEILAGIIMAAREYPNSKAPTAIAWLAARGELTRAILQGVAEAMGEEEMMSEFLEKY